MGNNPAARQWTHRLFAGIREFAITTIGLALVYVLLWLAYIGMHLSVNKDAPLPRTIHAVGHILPTPFLGGLHHLYVGV
jgi:hypothetical protein